MRLDHDHMHTPLSQPNGSRDASNATAGHDNRPGWAVAQSACRAQQPPDDGPRAHHGQVASRRHRA